MLNPIGVIVTDDAVFLTLDLLTVVILTFITNWFSILLVVPTIILIIWTRPGTGKLLFGQAHNRQIYLEPVR